MTDETKTEKVFEFKESNHSYTLDGKRMTGVTTILNVISKPALIGWAAKEAVRTLGWYDKKYDNKIEGEHVLVLRHAALKETDTDEFYDLLETGRVAHTKTRDKTAQSGTSVHLWLEAWIKDSKIELPNDDVAKKQATKIVNWIKKNNIEFLVSEKKVYFSPSLEHWKKWIKSFPTYIVMNENKIICLFTFNEIHFRYY